MSTDNELYLHINNGGVTFSVEDEGSGPLVRVSASHFGHPTASTGVMVTRNGLRALAAFFAVQAEREFSEPYCCAAEVPDREERACCGQADTGQTGEHPCKECGLPLVHDPVDAEDR